MGRTPKATKLVKNNEEGLHNWKKKAKYRGQRVNLQKKRINWLCQSRDNWKSKYKAEQLKSRYYQKQLAEHNSQHGFGDKVAHHSYNSWVILVTIQIRSCGLLSLRSCQNLLLVFQTIMKMEFSIPCISTIRNWEHKIGYHQLNQRANPKDNYAIIIDESFCIGKQTLMLVLGVNLSRYKWGQALNFESVQVLAMGVKPYWKGQDVVELIENLVANQYRISYSISDGGNNLVKAFKVKHINRIEDCTHAFSKLIERRYKEDGVFQEFCKKCSLLNRQCWMSAYAVICPPKLRGKARFLNLYPLADWGVKNLKLLNELRAKTALQEYEKQLYEKLKWLDQYQLLIEQLILLAQLMKICFKLLKEQGLSKGTIAQIKTVLTQQKAPAFFEQGVRQYLERNATLLDQHEHLLCCSDIIESFFGKYKSQQSTNPNQGITASCLRIPNYGKACQEQAIVQALQKVKMIDLQKWQQKNLLPTLKAKKNRLYKKCG